MNKYLIEIALQLESVYDMAYHRLAYLAGMNEHEANCKGYCRMELINLLTNQYKRTPNHAE